jgi:hypothetical protein
MSAPVRIVFVGRFRLKSFTEFVEHRARRLGLEATIDEASATRFGTVVAGQPELIDAFEMACSLGPFDCLILDVERNDRSIKEGEFRR